MGERKLYLTYDWKENRTAYLAVISEGHPRMGDDHVTVCTVELLPSPRACRQWFRRMRKERPWEARH
jgi:hypothetical protein